MDDQNNQQQNPNQSVEQQNPPQENPPASTNDNLPPPDAEEAEVLREVQNLEQEENKEVHHDAEVIDKRENEAEAIQKEEEQNLPNPPEPQG